MEKNVIVNSMLMGLTPNTDALINVVAILFGYKNKIFFKYFELHFLLVKKPSPGGCRYILHLHIIDFLTAC